VSETSETAVPARPDSVPVQPDAEEPESDLRWALGHPAEALKRLRAGVWLGAGLLALTGVRLASGDVGWWVLAWGLWGTVVAARACTNGGPFGRGADEPEPGEEEQWIETDQPVIGIPVRILMGVFGTLMMFAVGAVLLSGPPPGAEILLPGLLMGLTGGAMLYTAVRGDGNVRVLAPPTPHPAYLLDSASSSDPAADAPALPGGDALPDLPVRSPAEPAPAPRSTAG
jgi:hypothetical protein